MRQPVYQDVSPPLKDLAQNAPAEIGGEFMEMEPVRRTPMPPGLKPPEDPDLALQNPDIDTLSGPPPLVFKNFDGLGQGVPPGNNIFVAPPDTNGAVGLTQYVEWVNTNIAVYDKRSGSLLLGPVAGTTLWRGVPNSCGTNNDGDPIVVYDKQANRWVLSQFAVRGAMGGFGPFFECIAVSTTSDATGSFVRYVFQFNNLNDYPKMGVWPDGYYTTYNIFDGTTLAFLGAETCAFDRNAMLSGLAANAFCFQLTNSVFSLLPSDQDGSTPPPAGSPNVQITFGSNSLELYQFHFDPVTPANSTFTGPTTIPVTAFSPLCGGGTCVPQSGTTNQLDSLASRMMYRLAYRNFGNHESLVVNNSVVVGNGGGLRWYEIRDPNGTPTIFQQSTFAPDSNFRWMGSIAMNRAGDMALGYSISGSNMFPSIGFAGRTPADPVNTLEAETVLLNGTGSQTGSLNRWGDYSAMQIDPVDDCTFWFTTEYLKNSGSFNWNTRIASFRYRNCPTRQLGADFDADLKTDLTIFRPGTGEWWIIPTTTGAGFPQVWGTTGDIPVAGDYDGDGKADVAIWRPSTGTFWVIPSSTGAGVSQSWGVTGDIPVPGDYDADGKTDYAVWRPSTGDWWVLRSSDGNLIHSNWGVTGDIPVPGDYDGDGITDFAIWRPSTGQWWILRSSDGMVVTMTWGVNGDIPVPGDYDGDGKTDIAIWRPSTGQWWIVRSSDGVVVTRTWGVNGDVPVPADYDGDGKTDMAIWRPSTGQWWVIRSSTGSFFSQIWGVNGDVPINKPAGQ